MSNFPNYYTIDELGLDSLCYFLRQEFADLTVKILVEPEQAIDNEIEMACEKWR